MTVTLISTRLAGLLSLETVITALPGATPNTLPWLSTVTTLSLLLVKVTALWVVFDGVNSQNTLVVSPTLILSLPIEAVRLSSVTAFVTLTVTTL